jgi:hypothetical protein
MPFFAAHLQTVACVSVDNRSGKTAPYLLPGGRPRRGDFRCFTCTITIPQRLSATFRVRGFIRSNRVRRRNTPVLRRSAYRLSIFLSEPRMEARLRSRTDASRFGGHSGSRKEGSTDRFARSLSAGPGVGGCASAGTCNRLLASMADEPSRFNEGYVAASIKIPMLLIMTR